MLHGAQRGLFDLSFETPAVCADRLESGEADIGIVPAIELGRLGLEMIPGSCIASRGPVRSILLISKVPLDQIQTLAADSSSRTSVMLARVVLAERFDTKPDFTTMAPDLSAMLERADAALIIGDPALRINPSKLPYRVHDLGAEWTEWTGHPMVFAVWASRKGLPREELAAAFRDSAAYGSARVDEIVAAEAATRNIPETLARQYLTQHIQFELGEKEEQGLKTFLEYASRGVRA
jgi:predicted solute-binding protein